ncbi:MAG: hypothetical protein TREMPRED_001109 [Tremellales sp. Tagirdzhanova-0007]|nr:MAG: hypothetical protein TREMPRED_001109 [Tremellales sp. Tagirdzhanova-0007]
MSSSLRVKLTSAMTALLHMTILMLFYAAILFARNDLNGMDELQEKLVTRVVGIAFIGDPILYTILLATLPRELLFNPSRWNETLRGIVFVPLVGMAWKVIWLLGIGRATTT